MLRTQKAQNAFRHVCRLLNNRRKNKTSEHRAAQKYIKRCHNILFMMVVCNKNICGGRVRSGERNIKIKVLKGPS